jgi:phospholipase C
VKRTVRLAALAAAALVLHACSGGAAGGSAASALPAARADGARTAPPIGKYIKHIVVIVQENRSMTNLFAGYPGADVPKTGMYQGRSVALKPVSLKQRNDIDHFWGAAVTAYDDGKMDGFDISDGAYTYVRQPQVQPYWTMASQYVLADRMFATEFGPSFTAHLDLIAGTTHLTPSLALVNIPNGAWRCDAVPGTKSPTINSRGVIKANGPFPCFTQFNTMAQVLDGAHVSWRYYSPPVGGSIAWSAFDSIKYVWDGPDWNANVFTPQTRVLTDAASGALPSMTWISPDFTDSDHPGNNSDTGPSWVAAIVNSIGQGPDWNSTAIFVVWDDWGGFYDNAVPPKRDFLGLGIRVPFIVISPYAKKGYVSHTVYEFGSVLKFAEQAFNLPRIGDPALGYTDTRAASLADAFDFTQAPRPFVKIPAKYPMSHFASEKPSGIPPDDI